MKKNLILVLILLVLVAGGIVWLALSNASKGPSPAAKKSTPVVIGLSLGSSLEERWLTDSALFIERAKELNATVTQVVSNNDVDTQISQIRNLISQGIKSIVVVAADSEKLAPVVAEAHAAGAKIIAYDRMIKNCDLDMYVSFDSVKVGEMEAQSVYDKVYKGNFAYIGGSPSDNNAFLVKQGSMSVLDSHIKSGDIKLVIEKFHDNWDPTAAYQTIKEYLATGKTLDAVVCANDGMAYGVIKALREKGLAGSVPVSGQDADLAACQRVIAGTQTSTVYKPLKSLAYQAADIAVALARGEAPTTNDKVTNGKIDVPSFLIQPVLVNKENMMSTVVKDGFHTFDEIFNPPAK